jgi:two-component system response regulator RegX3
VRLETKYYKHMPKKILIIEDERALADSLSYAFKKEGFEVTTAADGDEGLSRFQSVPPDMVILDLMLPGLSGEDICREIRKAGDTPILVLSAKDTETDKVVALELGADDYVTKPFSLREVIARVRGLLRRGAKATSADEPPELSVGLFSLDIRSHQAIYNGQMLTLTPKEFDLLALFMRNPGQVLTPQLILERVWGYDYYGSDKTVNVYIKKLREKIGDDGSLIKNIRGVGYKLEVKTG